MEVKEKSGEIVGSWWTSLSVAGTLRKFKEVFSLDGGRNGSQSTLLEGDSIEINLVEIGANLWKRVGVYRVYGSFHRMK